MQTRLAAAIVAAGLFMSLPAKAQAPGEKLQELGTILIVGEQPGPGLWKVSAARKALDKNKSSFAVLNLSEMLSPDGHVAKLKELGYMVEDPS
jgi:hypothetical protein